MIDGTNALIIAAHPDDEVLGAGGWMARYPGTKVAIVSEGTSAECTQKEFMKRLAIKRAATAMAAQVTKSEVVWEGEYTDQCLQVRPVLIDDLTAVIRRAMPHVILTHAASDLNQDHRVVAEAVAVAARPFLSQWVRAVLAFTVDVWTAPGMTRQTGGDVFLALTEDQLEMKLRACALYGDAMRAWPHPRSIEALRVLARATGARVGRPAAEHYSLLWGCQ